MAGAVRRNAVQQHMLVQAWHTVMPGVGEGLQGAAAARQQGCACRQHRRRPCRRLGCLVVREREAPHSLAFTTAMAPLTGPSRSSGFRSESPPSASSDGMWW